MKIEDVRSVLTEKGKWFEPDMPDQPRFLLDNCLTWYPYIIVRVDTGISKDDDDVTDCFKVYAVNLKQRKGWIRTQTVLKENGWQQKLIDRCRQVWRSARNRAKKMRLVAIHIDNWLSQKQN